MAKRVMDDLFVTKIRESAASLVKIMNDLTLVSLCCNNALVGHIAKCEAEKIENIVAALASTIF